MRIGMTSGRGFAGTVKYDLDVDGRNDKEAEIIHSEGVDIVMDIDGKYIGDPNRIARSFRIQAEMNPRVQKCVKHMYLSYLPDDKVAMVNNAVGPSQAVDNIEQAVLKFGQDDVNRMVREAMVKDWMTVLDKLGYKDIQYMLVMHSEKSHPHSHCILNMVDNYGNRLKDHGEIRKGVKICRDLTIERGYEWGDHKSVSQSRSERPYERERQSICQDIFRIVGEGTDAWTLKHEAAKVGITVRYRTELTTGLIKGISFERNGIRFQGRKLDRSLSVNRILPKAGQKGLTPQEMKLLMTLQAEKCLKEGGVVSGINNQPVLQPIAPPAPKYSKSKNMATEHRESLRSEKQLNNTQQPKQEQRPKQEVKASNGLKR